MTTRPNPFLRPGETPQQGGGRWEKFWAKLLGTEPTIGSGNQWTAPMDIGDGRMLWSLKHSSKDKLRWGSKRVKELMAEIQKHLKGDPDVIAALAVHEEDGSTWVVLAAEDFIRMVQQGNYKYVTPTKGEQKRMRSKVPALLREEDDEAS